MSKIKFVKTSVFFLLFCFSISSQDYDILIQNGHVIDLKNKIDDVYDIAISKNIIVSVVKKCRIPLYVASKNVQKCLR